MAEGDGLNVLRSVLDDFGVDITPFILTEQLMRAAGIGNPEDLVQWARDHRHELEQEEASEQLPPRADAPEVSAATSSIGLQIEFLHKNATMPQRVRAALFRQKRGSVLICRWPWPLGCEARRRR